MKSNTKEPWERCHIHELATKIRDIRGAPPHDRNIRRRPFPRRCTQGSERSPMSLVTSLPPSRCQTAKVTCIVSPSQIFSVPMVHPERLEAQLKRQTAAREEATDHTTSCVSHFISPTAHSAGGGGIFLPAQKGGPKIISHQKSQRVCLNYEA